MSVVFKDFTKIVLDKIHETGETFLEEVGGEVEAQTKRNTKVDTGKTKGSWEHIVNADKMEVTPQNDLTQIKITQASSTDDFAIGDIYVVEQEQTQITKGLDVKDYYGNKDNDGHIMFAFYNCKDEEEGKPTTLKLY